MKNKFVLCHALFYLALLIAAITLTFFSGARPDLRLPVTLGYALLALLAIAGSILTFRFLTRPRAQLLERLDAIEAGNYSVVNSGPGDPGDSAERVTFRIGRRLRESEQKLRVVFEITRLVSSLIHLREVLDAVVDLLVREFQLDACSIRMLDEAGNLKIVSQKGLSEAFVTAATRPPTINSYSGDCYLKGQMIIVQDAEKIDKPISTNVAVGEQNIKSFALTPIRAEGETIGVLVTASNRKFYFHERFHDIIHIIADQIGIAIKLAQLYGQISRARDELEAKVRERTGQLEAQSRRLVEAERLAATGRIVNRVAHELRNSLTVIGGFARRLGGKTPEGDPNHQYAQIIVQEVAQLEKKLTEILTSQNADPEAILPGPP